MQVSNNLDDIRNNLLVQKLQNEINYLQTTPHDQILSTFGEVLTDRISYLEEQIKNHQPIVKNTTDNYFAEAERAVYRAQWGKLLPMHQINKLKEYIQETIENTDLGEQILTELSVAAETKSLKIKKHVVYDPSECKILSIPCLTITNDTYNIKLY